MKYEVTGRVVGHAIFCPNPKDDPDLELIRVALTLSPATSAADKHTRAILVVEKDAIWHDFVIGRVVRLTLEDSQQDLLLPTPSNGRGAKATLSTTDPKTGEVIQGELGTAAGAGVIASVVGRALNKGSRSGRGRGH